jgi:hypothetical protein
MLSESDTNLVAEVIKAIGHIAYQLNWNQYYKLLSDFLHQLSKNEAQQMPVLKAVCEILDKFHFELSEDSTDGKASKVSSFA